MPSNMAPDWLTAVLAANREAGLKIDDSYHRFYHGIALENPDPWWLILKKWGLSHWYVIHRLLENLCVI